MLKLKYLFENFNLAKECLKLYNYDESSINKMLNFFRISSNMIYPFLNKNKELCFLRISPTECKDFYNILAEIEFINYLNDNGFNANELVINNEGAYVSKVKNNFGEFIVCAFRSVNGCDLNTYFEKNNPSSLFFYEYGRMVAKFHNLSNNFKPSFKRTNDILFFETIEKRLNEFCINKDLIEEFKEIKKEYFDYPVTETNYGLIHYDLEFDNLFINDKHEFSVIDFDDSFYSFYDLDIVRCLNEIDNIDPKYEKDFISGYESLRKRDDMNISLNNLFKLSYLDHYAELLYILDSEKELDFKPDWMNDIIQELKELKEKLEIKILETI